jgi:hypothetical protein
MKRLNVKEDIMTTTPAPSPMETPNVSELIEVALNILGRHRDRDLDQKTVALQEVLEIRKKRSDLDCGEPLNKAVADLANVVQSHLNAEIDAVATLWAPYITASSAVH